MAKTGCDHCGRVKRESQCFASMVFVGFWYSQHERNQLDITTCQTIMCFLVSLSDKAFSVYAFKYKLDYRDLYAHCSLCHCPNIYRPDWPSSVWRDIVYCSCCSDYLLFFCLHLLSHGFTSLDFCPDIAVCASLDFMSVS